MPDTSDETDPSVEPAALVAGEVPRSLVCNECGKKFRSQEQAQFHATRTEHVDFAESTEAVNPLTKKDLDELREKLKQKKLADQKAAELEARQADAKRVSHSPSIPSSICWVLIGLRRYIARRPSRHATS